jgi:hypothetical protein
LPKAQDMFCSFHNNSAFLPFILHFEKVQNAKWNIICLTCGELLFALRSAEWSEEHILSFLQLFCNFVDISAVSHSVLWHSVLL